MKLKRIVKKFGTNGAHIIVPKKAIGKKVTIDIPKLEELL